MNPSNGEEEKAEEDVRHAKEEIKHAVEELAHAEHDLERAERELEEAHKHKVIHFEVDGEPEETHQRRWTPDAIIKEFAKKDPATHYLIRIENGGHKESYRDKGEVEIELHDGMCFQVIAVTPTPVSDGQRKSGVPAFLDGLTRLGFEPTILSGTTDHVVFSYTVPIGRFAEKQVRLGFVVPAEFPAVLPTGPHVSPLIHPTNTSGPHPTGSVHEAQAVPFRAAGGDWQYWSRPYPNPATTHEPVQAYMNFIWTLWETQ